MIEGDWAIITVRDHGIGIPATELVHVFERFQRGSNVPPQTPGTGIGLAYVHQVVIEHGGSVSAESLPGRQTTLTIRLPMATEPK